MCTLKFDMNKYSSLQNYKSNHRKPTLTYAKAAMYNCNKKLHVCVVTDICRNICKMFNKVDYDFTNFVVSQMYKTCIKFCT